MTAHQANKSSAIPGWAKALAVSAGILATAWKGCSFDARCVSRLDRGPLASDSEKVGIDALTYGSLAGDPLFELPNRIEHELLALGEKLPECKALLEHKISLRLVEAEQWQHPANQMVAAGPAGTFNINGAAIYRILDTESYRFHTVGDAHRCEVAAYHLIPSIVGIAEQLQQREALRKAGLPEELLASSELIANVLAKEHAVSLFLNARLSPRVRHAVLDESTAHGSLTGWRSTSSVVAGPGQFREALEKGWGVPSGAQLVKGSEQLSAVQQSGLREAQKILNARIGGAAEPQHKRVEEAAIRSFMADQETRTGQACSDLNAAAIEERLAALQSFWAKPEEPKDRAGWVLDDRYLLKALHHRGELAVRAAEDCATWRMALTGEARAAFEQAAAPLIESLTTEFVRMARNEMRSTDNGILYAQWDSIETSVRLGSALADCTTARLGQNSSLAECNVRITEEIERLLASGINSSSIKDQFGAYAQFALIRPGIHDLLGIYSRLEYHDKDYLASCSARYKQLPRGFQLPGGVKEEPASTLSPELRELCRSFSEPEREWIELLCTVSINNAEIPYMSHGVSSDGIREALNSKWFGALTTTAQTALLVHLGRVWSGEPRPGIFVNDIVPLLGPRASEGVLAEIEQVEELTKDLAPHEASVIVEGYFSLPRGIRENPNMHICSNYSPLDSKFVRLLCASRNEPGPLYREIEELVNKRPEYEKLSARKIVDRLIATEFPTISWASNVSVFSSSTAEQVSFGGQYGERMHDALSRGCSLVEAHREAVTVMRNWKLEISHPGRWVDACLDNLADWEWREPMIGAGVHQQTPQMSLGAVVPANGPTRALILYGANKRSDRKMNFHTQAKDWETSLGQRFGCESIVRGVTSGSELDSAVREFRQSVAADKNGEVDAAIIVIGHGHMTGASSELPDSQGIALLGEVTLQNKFVLYEAQLKSAVNGQIAPECRTVSVIVCSCHAGAFSE